VCATCRIGALGFDWPIDTIRFSSEPGYSLLVLNFGHFSSLQAS
jgi:hypothetical protein